jgi:hypothetical protein
MVDYAPLERNRWFTDHDGARATSKTNDEIVEVVYDLGDQIGGDLISSVAYEDSGVTRTNTSNTTKRITTNVAGLGEFTATVTLSSGRKVERTWRFYGSDGARAGDYR